MRILAAAGGLILAIVVLIDIFHTIVVARRTRRSLRVTRAFYKLTWRAFCRIGRRIRSGALREDFLGVYGPLSILALYALWAFCLALGFAMLQWGVRADSQVGFDLYHSATTLLTLDSGVPRDLPSKLLVVIEAGVGFALLGLVIAYLPVLYQAFSQRELHISLLDARAGSPPSAVALLRIHVSDPNRVERYLERSERWAADTLQSQLSFPMLGWFRSLHVNQSWLTAVTALIDWAAVISLCSEGDVKIQADYTFAMMRHVLVDLVDIFSLKPDARKERLSSVSFDCVARALATGPAFLHSERLREADLRELTRTYEPYAQALSAYLLMALPAWDSPEMKRENWKTNHSSNGGERFAISDPFRDT